MNSKSMMILTVVISMLLPALSLAQNKETSTTTISEKPIIKVFSLVNRDATKISDTIKELFSLEPDSDGLRVGIDERTNSIIVSGAHDDVDVVANLIKRLDKAPQPNSVFVVRLKNAPALDVERAISDWLMQKAALTGFKQKVNVVSEAVSNSLIISSPQSKKVREPLLKMIAELDKRPEMIKVKVIVTRTVDGKQVAISKPQIVTIEGTKGEVSISSGNEEFKIQLTPYIIKDEIRQSKKK